MAKQDLTIHPFLRQVEVIIGPLPEYKGGGNPDDAIRIYGDGTPKGFRIKFQINTPWLASSITIYNLSPALRKSLYANESQLVVRVGWQNVDMFEIFRGSLLAAFNTRQGPDIITELIGFYGWYAKNRAVASLTFGQGTPLKSMIISLAASFEGVTVDEKMIQVNETLAAGAGGYTTSGLAQEALLKLARANGFTWGITNGVFWAISHDQWFSGGSTPTISGKNGYLLRAEPMLSGPLPARTGVFVSSLFHPFVKAMHKFKLESTVNPDLDGEYTAHAISHTGDTHSTQWNTDIQSWIIGIGRTSKPMIRSDYTSWSDIEIIAGTIYGEAGGEPTVGKQAVAMTIKTRVNNPKFWPGGWRAVCLSRNQFVCWVDNKDKIIDNRDRNTSVWQECMAIAQAVYSGESFNVGLTAAPTNFHSGPKPSRGFEGLDYIGRISGHMFYNKPGVS